VRKSNREGEDIGRTLRGRKEKRETNKKNRKEERKKWGRKGERVR
jgi:hypothetical protein